MRFKGLDIALLLLAGALTSGCVGHDVLAAKDSFEETRPLEPGGTFRLQNTNGRVTVTCWDESRVRIEAERAAASERALEAIEIDVRGGGDRVEVTTRLPRGFLFGHAGAVEYHVTLPRQARLEIETVNGRVSIEGITGSVSATTVNGSIEIADASGEVEASTVNGSSRTDFPLEVTGRLCKRLEGRLGDGRGRYEIETVNGSVRIREG